MAGTPWRR